MESRDTNDTLVSYPYVKVWLGCRKCDLEGSYSLARLADKFGANIRLSDLLAQLAGDCALKSRAPLTDRCGAFFVDLDWPCAPPTFRSEAQRRLCVVRGGRK
jgi:hypothetical protein